MRWFCILALVAGCGEDWYAVSRPALRELKSMPGAMREKVAVRAERDSDDERVLIRASYIEEQRESGQASFSFVRTRRPHLALGAVALSVGIAMFGIGMGIYGASGFDVNSFGGAGPVGAAGLGVLVLSSVPIAVGGAFIGVGLRNPQEVPPGKLAVEIGVWPVPRVEGAF